VPQNGEAPPASKREAAVETEDPSTIPSCPNSQSEDQNGTEARMDKEREPLQSANPEFPILAMPPDTSVLPRFELCQYQDVTAGIDWTRASPDEHGVQLFDFIAGGIRSQSCGPVDVVIEAAAWERLHLKPIPGNSIVIITKAGGEAIQIMFDRKKGDEKISSGKVQARKFVDWLRDARSKVGLKLKASCD
jgi:hypothetical protein